MTAMTRFDCFALVAALSLAGCGTSSTTPPCTAEQAATCIADQRGCELDAAGAPACVPCGVGRRVGPDGVCAAIEGTPLSHAFPEQTSMPGEEISGLCRSWTLGNETELWVHAVELSQDEASHHSNWTFMPDTMFAGEDGIWRCRDRGYDQLAGALAGGVLYAQSTQAAHEVQRFGEGAAIRIPPHARIIGDVHILNNTEATVTGNVELTIYTVPRSQVQHALTPFHIDYVALDIPPRTTSRFVTECDLAAPLAAANEGVPVPVRLFYSLPHTHALGSRVFFQAVGGPRDGEMLLDVRGYNGEARGLAHSPSIDLTGVQALRFGCEFENPRDEAVGYGIGDQEMCEMLGFIESSVAFEARVSATTERTMDGTTPVLSGACETIAFPWTGRAGE